MPESIGEKYLNRLKRAARREVREARGWLADQAKEALAAGASAAATVGGQLLRGDYTEALPGPTPAERHRMLLSEGQTEHTTRMRKVPKVNK